MHALLKLQKTNIATSLCKIKKMGEKEKEGNNRGRGGRENYIRIQHFDLG